MSEMGNVDFAAMLARLQALQPNEEALRKAAHEESLARLQEWRTSVAHAVPAWPFASRGTPWWAKLDTRLRNVVDTWRPVVFDKERPKAGVSMVVFGVSGAGKSTSVWSALRESVRHIRLEVEGGSDFRGWCNVVWVSELQLVAEQAQRKADLFRKACAADVLILDELGHGNGHVAPIGQAPVIMALLSDRYDQGKTTSATVGLSPKALMEKYGTGVVRRLQERGTVLDLLEVKRG
jgi:hypothetical protein